MNRITQPVDLFLTFPYQPLRILNGVIPTCLVFFCAFFNSLIDFHFNPHYNDGTMMSLDEYKQALKTVRVDLETMRRREVEVNDELLELRAQIADLVATERSLSRLCGEDSVSKNVATSGDLAGMLGLTDAVRALLKALYPEAMTALDVRNRLASVGFDSKRFTNLTASIHSTLKRLERTGEVKKSRKNDKAAYEWNPAFKKAE